MKLEDRGKRDLDFFNGSIAAQKWVPKKQWKLGNGKQTVDTWSLKCASWNKKYCTTEKPDVLSDLSTRWQSTGRFPQRAIEFRKWRISRGWQRHRCTSARPVAMTRICGRSARVAKSLSTACTTATPAESPNKLPSDLWPVEGEPPEKGVRLTDLL